MELKLFLDLFTVDEFKGQINRLSELDGKLDLMLDEYQPNQRCAEIEELKVYCNPILLTRGLEACLDINREAGKVSTRDLRSIPLEEEFFKCEGIDWRINSWCGKATNKKKFTYPPHPWTTDSILHKIPEELALVYESVMTSYFNLFNIDPDLYYGQSKTGDRQLAWGF